MTSPTTDRPGAVRPGEALDASALADYLARRLPDLAGPAPTVEIAQFPGGYSNLTYAVRVRGLEEREMVLRRPPFGNRVKSAHDMGREFRVLHHLSQVYPPAPKPYLYCEDESILGAPFYLMERRHGVILRRDTPAGVALEPATVQQLSEALIDNLVRLHGVDTAAAGLGDLGKPEGYVERQVRGWADRYQRAKTSTVPAMEQLATWLADHLPRESSPPESALIHNDYKYDNLLLHPENLAEIVAVLDWEMCTVGHPLMDLGTSLAYWVQADDPEPMRQVVMGPTHLPGSLTRRELAQRYGERSGRDLSHLLFYYAFGLFKLAVILQQIYARFHRGATQDPRFAHLDKMVAVLAWAGGRALEVGHI
jgi:aminoglycoside phosphotransferase (APT) family kinase protein